MAVVYLSDTTVFTGLADCIRNNIKTDDEYTIQGMYSEFSKWEPTVIGPYTYYRQASISEEDLSLFENKTTLVCDGAFRECTALSKISLPYCTEIGDGAFKLASAITSYALPNCSKLGEEAFYGTNIKVIDSDELPYVSEFERGVFSACSKLTTVSIGTTVNDIASYAFADCSVLHTLSFTPAVTVNPMAFANCVGLGELGFSTNAYNICSGAFVGASIDYVSFAGRDLPQSAWFSGASIGLLEGTMTTSVNDVFFEGHPEVASVSFPICQSLKINSDSASCISNYYWGVTDNNLREGLFYANKTVEGVHFSLYTALRDNEFYSCPNLKTADIPSCNIINQSAFANCVQLQSIDFPDCIYVGNLAFANCEALSQVYLSTAIFMGVSAFAGCYDLMDLRLPQYRNSAFLGSYTNTLSKLTYGEFYNIDFTNVSVPWYYPSLETLILTSQPLIPAEGMYSHSGIKYVSCSNCTYIGASAFADCQLLTTVNIPAITIFSSYAFYNCTSLMSIPLSKAQVIDQYAFAGCPFLAELSILSIPNCSSIGTNAFLGFDNLTELYAPALNMNTTDAGWGTGVLSKVTLGNMTYPYFKGAKSLVVADLINYLYSAATSGMSELAYLECPECLTIAPSAFQFLTALESASFPKCTLVGADAFLSCSKLATIDLSVCKALGAYAFDYCENLSTVNLPACSIIYSGAFRYCASLADISIPACTRLYSGAFYACTTLSNIHLPSVCSSLGVEVFYGCYNLQNIYLNYPGVVSGNLRMLSSTPFAGFTSYAEPGSIYVPSAYLSAYQQDKYWAEFSKYFVAI